MKNHITKTNDMSPVEIKIALMRAGVSQQQIASELGVTRQSVNGVVLGRYKSEAIDDAICKIINLDKKLLRPSRYLYSAK